MAEGVESPFVSSLVFCVSVDFFSSPSHATCLLFRSFVLGVCCVRTWGLHPQSIVWVRKGFFLDLCNKRYSFFHIEFDHLLRFYCWGGGGFNKAHPHLDPMGFFWKCYQCHMIVCSISTRHILPCLVFFVTSGMPEFVVLTQFDLGSGGLFFCPLRTYSFRCCFKARVWLCLTPCLDDHIF